MKPLSQLTREEAIGLRGFLFDLDDTLLDAGMLTVPAYQALFRLADAGLRRIVVTGRPASWGEVLARQWPIDAALTENGAVALFREGDTIRRWEEADETTRRGRRVRLAQAVEAMRARFPEARLSDDTQGRVSDIAFDIGESQHVPADVVAKMTSEARALGFRTFVSTVHLHLTLDPYDKASGVLALLAERYGEDPTSARFRYAYTGDSANDDACFSAFTTTFGVANVRKSLPLLSVPPRYVAQGERGSGFAEIVDRIVRLRSAEGPC